ncbi:response regulator [Sphingomonas sp.]|uniref:response regulator n=1 Tax=Sphingomonas sp. TaxID=28214 RepID=UPI0025DF6881|nr:response regulator [Sphingomonas sp.]
MHVLIIEDEPLIAMSIEDALRDCGCASFDFATSAVEATAAARRRCPDLITADVQLAPGCGIDAVGAICGGKAIPVIFITSTGAEIQLRRPGSIIVHKPFDDADIKDAFWLATGYVDPHRPAAA